MPRQDGRTRPITHRTSSEGAICCPSYRQFGKMSTETGKWRPGRLSSQELHGLVQHSGFRAGCCVRTLWEASQVSLQIGVRSFQEVRRYHKQDRAGAEVRRRCPRPAGSVPRDSGLADIRDSVSTTYSASFDESFRLSVTASSARNSYALSSCRTPGPLLSAFC